MPARETTAGIREDVAAVNMNVDRPLRVSTETEMTLLLSRRYRHLARGTRTGQHPQPWLGAERASLLARVRKVRKEGATAKPDGQLLRPFMVVRG